MARAEEGRTTNNANLSQLAERLTQFTDQMRAEQQLMMRLAESHMEMKPLLAKLGDAMTKGGFGIDETTRAHIRNLDVHMARMLEDSAAGRNQMVQDLRSGARRTLLTNGYDARYLPSGHLIFTRGRSLMAVRLDLASMTLQGTPVPLIEDLSGYMLYPVAQFDLSATGTLVYAPTPVFMRWVKW